MNRGTSYIMGWFKFMKKAVKYLCSCGFIWKTFPKRLDCKTFVPTMSSSVPSFILPKNRRVYYVILCTLVIFILIWISMLQFSNSYSGNDIRYFNRNHSVSRTSPHVSSDYNKLINISFSFNLISVCGPKQPELLVLVHSAPNNFDKRKTIRETWGKNEEDVKILFMLGMPRDNNIQEKLEVENAAYKDFVQGNFTDTYHNLTYKHVMVLKYAVYHCPNSEFVLKVDDDVFVNMPNMKIFTKLLRLEGGGTNKILCSRMYGNPVLREGPWCVEKSEYPGDVYPNHCSGFAILYPRDLVAALYAEAQKTKFFWIDDVHVSGTLAKKANITHVGLEELILSNEDVKDIVDLDFTNITKPFLFGRMNLDVHQIRKLWDYVSKFTPKKSILDYLLY